MFYHKIRVEKIINYAICSYLVCAPKGLGNGLGFQKLNKLNKCFALVTLLPFSKKKMNYWYALQHGWTLQTLTERNQTWKTTYCVIPCVRTVHNRPIFRDRKRRVVTWGWEKGMESDCSWVWGFFFGWWNVQNSDMVMDAQHCECTKNTELYTLKYMDFMHMWTVSQ